MKNFKLCAQFNNSTVFCFVNNFQITDLDSFERTMLKEQDLLDNNALDESAEIDCEHLINQEDSDLYNI